MIRVECFGVVCNHDPFLRNKPGQRPWTYFRLCCSDPFAFEEQDRRVFITVVVMSKLAEYACRVLKQKSWAYVSGRLEVQHDLREKDGTRVERYRVRAMAIEPIMSLTAGEFPPQPKQVTDDHSTQSPGLPGAETLDVPHDESWPAGSRGVESTPTLPGEKGRGLRRGQGVVAPPQEPPHPHQR